MDLAHFQKKPVHGSLGDEQRNPTLGSANLGKA